MSCFCSKLRHGNLSEILAKASCESIEWVGISFVGDYVRFSCVHRYKGSSTSSEVSASELVYLRAQVWILEKKLEQEKNCLQNMTVNCAILDALINNLSFASKESFKKVANEKFELIQELTKQNKSYLQLCEDIQMERLTTMLTKSIWPLFHNEAIWIQRRFCFTGRTMKSSRMKLSVCKGKWIRIVWFW